MAKLLIVDDEKSIRSTLAFFLSALNHEVKTASHVDEAIEILLSFSPDCIITDIIMPKRSGVELLEYVHTNFPHIPVIIMTGEPSLETAVQAIQHAAIDYLSKPIHKDTFMRVVNRVLEIKELQDEKKRLEHQNEEYQKDLEQKVLRRTAALHKASKSIITLLSRVTEYRDPYTAGHQVRVGNFAADIALSMGLSQSQVEDIRSIGYIHDVGKIAVPAEILAKPGVLSKAERLLIQTHAESGHELLSDVGLPLNYAEVVYQHHERYNGSGYPRQLKKDQILLETHVLTVADVVEAMMSHRPYRAALGIEVALDEINTNSGILYHPKVVAACNQILRDPLYKIDDNPHELIFNTLGS